MATPTPPWPSSPPSSPQSPDYVPAYQMSAQTLAKLGRTDEALARLDAGIAAATRTGNQHALAEMEALRDDLT